MAARPSQAATARSHASGAHAGSVRITIARALRRRVPTRASAARRTPTAAFVTVSTSPPTNDARRTITAITANRPASSVGSTVEGQREHRRPDQVELLLDAERPVVLEHRRSRLGDGSRLPCLTRRSRRRLRGALAPHESADPMRRLVPRLRERGPRLTSRATSCSTVASNPGGHRRRTSRPSPRGSMSVYGHLGHFRVPRDSVTADGRGAGVPRPCHSRSVMSSCRLRRAGGPRRCGGTRSAWSAAPSRSGAA